MNRTKEPTIYDEYLDLAIMATYAINAVGSETHRAEDTGFRILQAYGMKEIEVFVLTRFLSISFLAPDGYYYQGQKNVLNRSVNMQKLIELNNLSRHITNTKPAPSDAIQQFKEILNREDPPLWQEILICGFVGLGFTFMLGGSLLACLYAFCIDVCLRLALIPLKTVRANSIFVNLVGGFIVSTLAYPAIFLGLESELGVIIPGSFMYLFPGISLTNSIRDIIQTDYLAGMTKLLETILTAMAVAAGSGMAITMFY